MRPICIRGRFLISRFPSGFPEGFLDPTFYVGVAPATITLGRFNALTWSALAIGWAQAGRGKPVETGYQTDAFLVLKGPG